MINGTGPLDLVTLKEVAQTVASVLPENIPTAIEGAGEALKETFQQTVNSENVQSVLSDLLQVISENTPAVVSETWNATVGEYPYVALATTAALVGGAFMLNRCRTAPAKSSKNEDSQQLTTTASSTTPSSSNNTNNGLGAEGEVGEKKSRSRSPSPRRGSDSDSE